MKPTALVLAGGPDAERPVSIESATAVAGAISAHGEFAAELRIIDAPASLADLPGDVIVPVLHGPWGEGGPLQDILERDGRPYVGCGPSAARLCMDKLAAKLAAARLGITTAEAALINTSDPVPPIAAPAVIKPVFEGSSVGLHICRDQPSLEVAYAEAAQSHRPMMIERLIAGREITCGLIDTGTGLRALPVIEIVPAGGTYDYAAKYDRDDTGYLVGDAAAPHADHAAVQRDALRLATALGVRHLARADFIVDDAGGHHLLEINTMPGFTSHSLLPKAAAALGVSMGELCTGLCRQALGAPEARHSSETADPVES
jgi:D-alanine-D-alanine ligase